MHSGPIAERHKPQGGKNMDNKAIAIVAVVAVAILAVAAFAVANPGGNNDDNKYVVYDGNGGKTSDGSTTYETEETVAIELDKFVRDGYKLVGWNTKADGTGTSFPPRANVMAGTTLYAQWEAESTSKLTVLFDNPYSDLISFSMNGVNIDKAGEYSIPAGTDSISVRPVGTSISWVVHILGNTVSIEIGGKTIGFAPAMVDGKLDLPTITPIGFGLIIPFTFEEGKNPQLNFGFEKVA